MLQAASENINIVIGESDENLIFSEEAKADGSPYPFP
jgi:hypothetical protein